jgi:excinuclease UvrABC nuclease subunit
MAIKSAIPKGRMNTTTNKSTLPNKPGIYHYKTQQGNYKYIGVTNNLNRRAKEHKTDGKLKSYNIISYKVCKKNISSKQLAETEKNHIAKHKPRLNKTGGGNGNIKTK